jgi:hypothetical protein
VAEHKDDHEHDLTTSTEAGRRCPMLVPGEYLLVQTPAEPKPQNPTGRGVEPPAPKVEVEEEESRSFLMILLRALGAIHS